MSYVCAIMNAFFAVKSSHCESSIGIQFWLADSVTRANHAHECHQFARTNVHIAVT